MSTISRGRVVEFVELVRMHNRRVDPARLGPLSGLSWKALHRLIGRLEALGYIRRDSRNIKWLSRDIDEELAEMLDVLADGGRV